MPARPYADLFWTFAKIGLFTFGGGYAMISMMERYCVEEKRWITQDEMLNVTVIAESTPGPIAINCATYVGYRQAGLPGAALATLAIVLPSFLLIYLISLFLDGFLEYPAVASAFRGVKLAVGLLILEAGLRMAAKMPATRLARGMLAAAAAVMLCVQLFAWKISSIALMLAAAAFSLALYLAGQKGKRGAK